MFSLSFFWASLSPRPSWLHAWTIFISLGLLAVVLSFVPKPNATQASVTTAPQQPPPHVVAQPASPAKQTALSSTLLQQDTNITDPLPASRKWDAEITVRSGDTLSKIFRRLGLSRSVPALLQLGDAGKSLHRLRPGQTLHINQDNQGLRHLMYQPTLRQRDSLLAYAGRHLYRGSDQPADKTQAPNSQRHDRPHPVRGWKRCGTQPRHDPETRIHFRLGHRFRPGNSKRRPVQVNLGRALDRRPTC